MNIVKLTIKLKALFLSLVILFQGCATYQGSYTLPQALKSNRSVKITTATNDKLLYRQIDTLNGQWVGQKVVNSKLVYEPLDPASIRKIEISRTNQAASQEGLIIVGILGGIVLVIAGLVIAFKNMSFY